MLWHLNCSLPLRQAGPLFVTVEGAFAAVVDVGPQLNASACLRDWLLDMMPMMGVVERVNLMPL